VRIVFKSSGLMVLALLLVACGVPKHRPSLPGTAPPAVNPRPPAGIAAYRIDSAQSELRLLVYRAGAMARFGHNHVIVNHALEGWVGFAGNVAAASFSMTVPVAAFLVDDAQMRSEEGADFPGEIPDDAKSGTRHNMLSASLLDAVRFPTITLTSVSVTSVQGTSSGEALTASVTVNVAGRRATLAVPFTLDYSVGRLCATGSVTLRQSALGLTPFSVMLGALQVQDEFTAKFKLVAVAN
jgi:polyisoprenoid-binding protein YceI